MDLVLVCSGVGFVATPFTGDTPHLTTDPVAAHRFSPEEGEAVAALMQAHGWEAVCLPLRFGRMARHD